MNILLIMAGVTVTSAVGGAALGMSLWPWSYGYVCGFFLGLIVMAIEKER